MHSRLVCDLFLGLFLSIACGHRHIHDIATRAKMYAKLHPNEEIDDPNPECGDHLEGDILVDQIKSDPILQVNNLWPGGILYYTVTKSQYTAEELEKLDTAMSLLVNLTKVNGRKCIQIVPRRNEANYVRVQNEAGCSSYVGMMSNPQPIILGSRCFKNNGTIMHEFLHAFGFIHEQKRTDRDDYVTINWANIREERKDNFKKLCKDEWNILGTPYDYNSVMHYGPYNFAIDKHIPTIVPHDLNAKIGQRVTLSKEDIERVQILYGCLKP